MSFSLIHARLAARRGWFMLRGDRLILVAGLLTLGLILWLCSTDANEKRITLVCDLLMPVVILCSSVSAWRASRGERLDRRARRAWRFVAAAAFAFFAGEVIWFYYEIVRGASPVMSWADPAFLSFYPLMLCGLLSFPVRADVRRSRATFSLDIATVMLGAGMIFWYFLLRPTAIAEHASWLESTVALCYPVGSLVVLFGVVAVLLRTPELEVRLALYVLTAGAAGMLVADTSYSYLSLKNSWVSGGWGDMLYIAAFYTLGFAAHVQRAHAARGVRSRDQAEHERRYFGWLPYAAVALGYGLLLSVTLRHWNDPSFDQLHGLIFGATGLAALVVGRQIIAVRENMRLHAEHAARREQARFRALVQNSSDVIMILASDLTVRYVSPSVGSVLGFAPAEVIDRPLDELIHPEDAPHALHYFRQAARVAGIGEPCEWRVRGASGAWLHVENVCNNLLDDAEIGGLVVNSRDVTDRKRIEERLRHDAFHDALTGLPNRALFVEHLLLKLERARRDGDQRFAVLFIDLDRFKFINDSLGHAAGDDLLMEIARRLSSALRPGDIVARLGGDEFAALVDSVGGCEDAARIAERIQRLLSAPVTLGGRDTYTTASIGITLGSPGYERAEDMLRDADMAMYHSKLKGCARHELFDSAMHRRVCDMAELETDLRRAVERREFFLVYQPIVRLDGASAGAEPIVGFEALVRWQHPTRGLVPPGEFIPLAEETNLIVPVGSWVLEEACRQMRRWQEAGSADDSTTISVNISSRQFIQPDIVEQIDAALRLSRLPARNLRIEVTESMMMDDTERMTEKLNRLRALGIRLSMDDFGTGYSSLSYLHRFPLSTLKIDRSFVSRLDEQDEHKEIVRTIVTLAKSLGMSAIAEGVETPAQRARLVSFGCEYAQGYLFSKPVSAEAAGDLLAAAMLDRPAHDGDDPRCDLVQAESRALH